MTDKKETVNGAEALIRSLLAEGVDTVFGYPGGAILPVYDRLYDYQDKLHHILVRHEQGAAHAAQGYARVSGRTGVVIVTSGPGAANVITGICDAMADSTPLVVITGQVGAQYLGSDAFQETDVVAITQPITKWSMQVRHAEDVPKAIARAFYIASSGRPGPVLLDIAKDAQIGLLEWGEYEKLTFIRSYDPRPAVKDYAVQRAAEIINNAQRPMILAGQGIIISGAENELAQLAETADIPVAATLLGLSALPSDHRLFKGMLGMHGKVGPNIATNRADVLIAIGMRFDDRVTGNTAKYAPNATIIHIDIDASEFDKTIESNVSILGDAKDVLEKLLPLINKSKHSDWLALFDRCDEAERIDVLERELHATSAKMTMGEVVSAVSKAAGDNSVAVTDVGQNQMMTARYFDYHRTRSLITSGGLGTMGFGLPAAIGAKICRPERTVCYFGGDGGFQMTIQELGTIMQYGIGVKMILLNNNFLGNVRQWQQLFFHQRFSQTPMLNPDFVGICDCYGIKAENVMSRDQLPAAIERMFANDEPYLLNVNIDETDMVFPMTPAGQAVDYIMLTPDKQFQAD
jgi:acetolactate synthase-1/2/3 large subunit